jgi:hypothetical protein
MKRSSKKLELYKEEKQEVLNRILKLYKDWASSKGQKAIQEMKMTLNEAITSPINFLKIVEKMGSDGKTMLDIYGKEWTRFGKSPLEAKKNIIKTLVKENKMRALKEDKNDGSVVGEFGLAYYPITDRSNAMESAVDLNDRDIVIQIRHAITGGNMEIAKQLILSSWGSLTLNDRNSLIEWINGMQQYNAFENAPEKGRKLLIKPLKTKNEMPKDEFAERFVKTAIENMKIS